MARQRPTIFDDDTRRAAIVFTRPRFAALAATRRTAVPLEQAGQRVGTWLVRSAYQHRGHQVHGRVGSSRLGTVCRPGVGSRRPAHRLTEARRPLVAGDAPAMWWPRGADRGVMLPRGHDLPHWRELAED